MTAPELGANRHTGADDEAAERRSGDDGTPDVDRGRRMFERAAATFRSVLVEVQPQQRRLPTSCRPLDVTELVSRAIGHQNWTRAAIDGTSAPTPYPELPADRWATALDESTAAMTAITGDGAAMRRAVTLAAGLTFDAPVVVVLAARNIFRFAWDLAGAIGQDRDLDPDLARELLELSRTELVPQRGPNGFFGPEQVPPDGAPAAMVLAGYLGRDVCAARRRATPARVVAATV